MNKILIICILFVVVVFVTGCAIKKSADEEQNENNINNINNNVDYIITTKIPKVAADGVKDTAEPGYVPINPNYIMSDMPKEENNFEWFKTGLGSRIPAFPGGTLLEVINTDKEFVAYFANVNEDIFRKYFETLFLNGFVGSIPTWEGFTLISPVIAVNLRYSQEPGSVTTVRARLLKNAAEYDKLSKELVKD